MSGLQKQDPLGRGQGSEGVFAGLLGEKLGGEAPPGHPG